MKSGPLSNTEKYCIQGMSEQNTTVKDMAKQLDRKEETVEKYLEKINHSLGKINAKVLMIKETTGKGVKGVSAMTEAASQRADESRKRATGISSKTKNAIYKIH